MERKKSNEPICDIEELTQLAPISTEPKLLENILENNARGRGFLEAFKRIKKDYKTHDTLLDIFGEAEGFVLEFGFCSYMSEKQESEMEAPYLSPDFNLPSYSKLLLIAQRSRDNCIVFSDINEQMRNGDSKETLISVYVPDQNVQKIQNQVGTGNLLEAENFALALLFDKATVDLTYQRRQKPEQNRDWSYSTKYTMPGETAYTSKMEGEDVIRFYKEAVKNAAVWQQRLNEYNGGDSGTPSFRNLVVNSQNVHLFNRNHSQTKNISTKVYGFEFKQLCL